MSLELRSLVERSSLQTFKDLENDLSQLNRLGVAYFLLAYFRFQTTYYFGFSSAQQFQLLLLSHSGSNDIQTTC